MGCGPSLEGDLGGTYAVTNQDLRVPGLHGVSEVLQNGPALLVPPVMQHGAHEIRARALDRLWREEVVHLELDPPRGVVAATTHTRGRGRAHDLSEFLQHQLARVLRHAHAEVLQDLAHAAANVNKGRGIPIIFRAQALD